MKIYLLIILLKESKNKTQNISQKISILSQSSKSWNTNEQQTFLTMVNFQNSQINQQEFEQLGELLLNYPMVYSTSKFHLRKTHLLLDLPLKPDAVFKK